MKNYYQNSHLNKLVAPVRFLKKLSARQLKSVNIFGTFPLCKIYIVLDGRTDEFVAPSNEFCQEDLTVGNSLKITCKLVSLIFSV